MSVRNNGKPLATEDWMALEKNGKGLQISSEKLLTTFGSDSEIDAKNTSEGVEFKIRLKIG